MGAHFFGSSVSSSFLLDEHLQLCDQLLSVDSITSCAHMCDSRSMFAAPLSLSCAIERVRCIVQWSISIGTHDMMIDPLLDPWWLVLSLCVVMDMLLCSLSFSHDLSFSVFSSFQDSSRKRWSRVVTTTILMTLVVFFVAGSSGYYMFYKNTQPNILDNFPYDDMAANVARLFVSLNILISVPYSWYVADMD